MISNVLFFYRPIAPMGQGLLNNAGANFLLQSKKYAELIFNSTTRYSLNIFF